MSKSKKVNKAWLNDHVNDPYVKLAASEGYRARAAYKLKEIDEALGLIRPGQVVVDLGCAPGAWSQYVRRRFAPKAAGSGGAAAARSMAPSSRSTCCRWSRSKACCSSRETFARKPPLAALAASLRRPRGRRGAVGHGAQPVGRRIVGRCAHGRIWWNWRSTLPVQHLKPDGALVCKVFHGSGYSQLVKLFKESFRVVKPIKPKASRDKSSETFLVGIGLKRD